MASSLWASSYSGSNKFRKGPDLILSMGLRWSQVSSLVELEPSFELGSKSKKMLLGTIFPRWVSVKKKFLEIASVFACPLFGFWRPSGLMPCSTQKSSQRAPPRLHPAPPTWIDMTSLYVLTFLMCIVYEGSSGSFSSSFTSSFSSSLLSSSSVSYFGKNTSSCYYLS